MNTTSGDKTDSSKAALLAWLRDNVKLLLLAANAVILIVLVFMLGSQVLFEMKIRRLLKQATVIEETVKKTEAPKADGKSPREARPSTADRSGRMMPPSERERMMARARGDRPSSQTTVSVSMATVSTTATTGVATLAADRRTTTTAIFSVPSSQGLPLRVPFTTGGIAIGEQVFPHAWGSSDPMAGRMPIAAAGGRPMVFSEARPRPPTAVGSVTTPTARILPTWLMAGARKAAVRIAESRKTLFRTLAMRSRMGGPSRGPSGGLPMGMAGPKDPKKKEKFTKLQQRFLFGEPRPPAQPQPQVEAVLGEAALIGGQWLTIGGRMGEWKVVEVGTDKVVMEDNTGRRQDFVVAAGGAGPPGEPSPMMARAETPGPPSAGGPTPPTGSGPSEPITVRSGEMPPIPDAIMMRLTGPGGQFEGMNREQVMEQIRSRRDERRDRGRGSRGND